MNINSNDIQIDDIPKVGRNTKEPSPWYLLAKYIDDCNKSGRPASGAQVVYKFFELTHGKKSVATISIFTLIKNASKRLFPGNPD